MEIQEVIRYIQMVSKKTPVKVYLNVTEPIEFRESKVFGEGSNFVVFGGYETIAPVLETESEKIIEIEIETAARYSAIPLLGIKKINTRIEPDVVIGDQVSIGNSAVIMIRAIISIGVVISEDTVIGIGAVLGRRATVGKNCHVGAGAILAGVIEPAPTELVIVENGVLVGADAMIVEDVHIGEDVVMVAGAVVLEDVTAETVVGGIPAHVLEISDDQTKEDTVLIATLREL